MHTAGLESPAYTGSFSITLISCPSSRCPLSLGRERVRVRVGAAPRSKTTLAYAGCFSITLISCPIVFVRFARKCVRMRSVHSVSAALCHASLVRTSGASSS